MSDHLDIFDAHYRDIRRDPALRQRLIDDPVAGLKEHFGVMPDGDYRIEVIPQEPYTIIIVLPAPVGGDTSDAAVDAASRRITMCSSPTVSAATSSPTRRSPGFSATCAPPGLRPPRVRRRRGMNGRRRSERQGRTRGRAPRRRVAYNHRFRAAF